MTQRIVIPTADDGGLNAHLANALWEAPYFTVIDTDENGAVLSVRAVANTGEHFGGSGHMHDSILELKPDAVVAYGMGSRALNGFQDAGVAVLRADADTVKELVAAYREDRLQELTEGCHQAHHK
jgi:predicted Fe-Mo cluster-binding NifX family protein